MPTWTNIHQSTRRGKYSGGRSVPKCLPSFPRAGRLKFIDRKVRIWTVFGTSISVPYPYSQLVICMLYQKLEYARGKWTQPRPNKGWVHWNIRYKMGEGSRRKNGWDGDRRNEREYWVLIKTNEDEELTWADDGKAATTAKRERAMTGWTREQSND